MAKPNDLGDFTALLDSLVERRFWGSLQLHFQDGGFVRCVLEESVKHPRQLMRNGNTVEAHDDTNQR
jgi:hypothetical protein